VCQFGKASQSQFGKIATRPRAAVETAALAQLDPEVAEMHSGSIEFSSTGTLDLRNIYSETGLQLLQGSVSLSLCLGIQWSQKSCTIAATLARLL